MHRGAGTDGTYTYPDQDPNAYPGGRQRNLFTADHDMLLLGTAGTCIRAACTTTCG